MSTPHAPFLRQLLPEDAQALVAQVKRRSIPLGQTIISGGAAGEQVVLVISGRVRLIAHGAEGREVVLAVRGPGELVGEMAALGAQRRTATAIALDAVEAGFLEGGEFRAYLRDHPDAALVLIRMLVRRLTEATRDVVDLATADSVGRVARRLLELSGGGQAELGITQDELARWIGTSRETVARALRLMRQLGWVTTEHRRVTVLDAEALRRRSGQA